MSWPEGRSLIGVSFMAARVAWLGQEASSPVCIEGASALGSAVGLQCSREFVLEFMCAAELCLCLESASIRLKAPGA